MSFRRMSMDGKGGRTFVKAGRGGISSSGRDGVAAWGDMLAAWGVGLLGGNGVL